MNAALPNHQYSSFAQLAERFGTRYVPKYLRWLYKPTLAVWLRVFGISKREHVISQDFANEKDGFWHSNWIWDELFYPEISATFIGESKPCDPVDRTAQLIHASMAFYLKASSDALPTENFSGFPQDMERYKYLFSRLTLARKDGKNLVHRITDLAASDYVVLGINGRLIKVKTLDQGTPIPSHKISEAIRGALKNEAPKFSVPIGLLTSIQNRTSIAQWQRLEDTNVDAMATLNSALFTVTIDKNLKSTDLNALLTGLNSHVFETRDCRRSMQLIVSGTGEFAAVVNPHAGIGGTLSARFVSELSRYCETEQHTDLSDSKLESQASELRFVDPGFDQKTLESLSTTIKSRLYPEGEQTTFVFKGIGADAFKNRGVNLDAAFHAALALAWFKNRGYIPTVGNFINLRSVKFGDIWRYDSTTDAMNLFVRHPSKESYLKAQAAHTELIKTQKSASDEFYLGAMAMKRLVCDGLVRFSGFVSLVMIMSMFVRDFVRRFLNPDLWVSCIPSFPGVKAAGRGGSMMSYLAKTSSGGHYMIFKDHIMVCLMNPKGGKWLGTEKSLASDIESSLHLILDLQ